jgi:hypothetical protein
MKIKYKKLKCVQNKFVGARSGFKLVPDWTGVWYQCSYHYW